MPEFKFASAEAFWTMGGHGPYVWSAVAIALVILAGLVVHPILAHRRQLNHLTKQHKLRRQQSARHASAREGVF